METGWRSELKSVKPFVFGVAFCGGGAVIALLRILLGLLDDLLDYSMHGNLKPFVAIFVICLIACFSFLICLVNTVKHNHAVKDKYKEEIEAEKKAAAAKREEAKARESKVSSNDNALSGFSEGTIGKPIYEIDGLVTNILRVYEDRCVLIAKTTVRSFVAGKFFNGTKEYFYQDLTNVQYREATKKWNGYLQFEYPGAVNINTGRSSNNYNSENTFVFAATTSCPGETFASARELEQTNQLVGNAYSYIRTKLLKEKQNKKSGETTIVQQLSAADEIKKYQDLLNSGAITQEEFDAKKKQLLGL